MIYIFDKTQAIIKVLTNDDFTAAHLNFKINTATTFEFSLPASKALPSGSKYVATPHPLNDSKFIMLRLTERVDNTETIDYSAYELAYQELATDGYIEDKRPHNQSALNLMKIALDGSNWELNNVNVSGTATTNFYYVDRLSAISKVVDLLGGEIVFYIEIQGNAISGRYMDYLARQGADTSKVFASGSNLLTVERQSDTSNIYTAILPRGKGEEIDNGEADTPDGYGRRINIADVEWKKSAGKPLDKPKGSIVLSDPDATAEWGQINGNARLLLKTYDDIDDVNVLINSAYKTLQSVNHPQIQYSATVADVGGLSLGDTVLIMHGDRDLSYKTRVFEVKYDLLSPDQTELSLGDDLSSNSITSQLNSLNAVADTTSSQTQWTINQIGRPGTTYGATAPNSPKVGDIWFKHLPDGGTEIYRWNGDIWELLASPTTNDDIAKAVDDAVSQAKSHIDEVKQGMSRDIETAKLQAASLASTAEANAKSQAVSQFNRAQNALSDAKTDLTKSIASEASARNEAVANANSQAQTYANQAKSDALNTIAKEVTDRQNAVSALDTKTTNAVNQAKSEITDTINAISVGGRNLLLGTKDFSGDSNLSITGEWGNLSLWWGRDEEKHKGFTVLKRGTAWGGLGQYYDVKPNTTYTFSFYAKASETANIMDIFTLPNEDWNSQVVSPPVFANRAITTEWQRYSITFTTKSGGTIFPSVCAINYNVTMYVAGYKLEEGTIPTDWTPAPEDVVLDYTNKDNKIKETITQYQETNDGKVIKAQTDATTALGLVATKVSQTDYDKKTGDLVTKYTQVKQTADSQATDIVDIKKTATSQASKINSISSDVDGTKQSISDIEKTQHGQSDKINQITNDVDGTKQSITDIQTKDGKQDARMGTIETSVSGVKSDFSSYKATNDGVVKTAQTTAQTAVDGLKTKVNQTDYDQKTGQLQTDLTSTTQTADQAKTDIASIKQKDGEQDEKMNTIVSDANGTKQTVSDLKTAQDKQSGYISTLQQSAKGFEETATKVDNLSVGGRNLLLDSQTQTKKPAWFWQNWTNPSDTYMGSKIFRTALAWDNARYQYKDLLDRGVINTTDDFTYSVYFRVVGEDPAGMSYANMNFISSATTKDFSTPMRLTSLKEGQWTRIVVTFRFKDVEYDPARAYNQSLRVEMSAQPKVAGAYYEFAAPKLERGSIATDYTPAPEDVASAVAKAQFTADQASTAVSKLTSADGIITKAQADIKANADAITQKVSQTVYGQKTGDLTKAVAKAQTTADGVVTTVGNYQTSNDARVKATETSIEQNSKDITLRATTSDLNSAKSDLNSSISQVKVTADGINNFVRDSSGNISSNFQTALSKTSIITDSTLASSIQKETSSQISSAIKDNNGKIISLINLDSSGVQIAGKNIVLDGNTTVTGDFYAKGGNFTNLNASNMTAGTLNASDVNIINLDVNSLTGNVSNWILSQWTSATGSKVTIDGNGLYFAPGTSRMTTKGFEAWRSDGGQYAAMGMVGSYSWQTNAEINGMGLIAKYYDQPHDDQADPYRNENWGADTIAIGALMPEIGRGYDYVDPFLVFPANGETGNRYFPGNGADTILMGRWLSIYTGLNMRGHAITNSSGYSLKENFDSVSGDNALEIFDNTDILTYDYKPDSNDMDEQTAAGTRNKVGFVINDNGQSPYKIDNRLVRYGNTRDDSVTVGYLMAAVKELHAKVKKLESLKA